VHVMSDPERVVMQENEISNTIHAISNIIKRNRKSGPYIFNANFCQCITKVNRKLVVHKIYKPVLHNQGKDCKVLLCSMRIFCTNFFNRLGILRDEISTQYDMIYDFKMVASEQLYFYCMI